MYCIRLAQTTGQWRDAGPRSAERLECKLAEMLRELERRTPAAA